MPVLTAFRIQPTSVCSQSLQCLPFFDFLQAQHCHACAAIKHGAGLELTHRGAHAAVFSMLCPILPFEIAKRRRPGGPQVCP